MTEHQLSEYEAGNGSTESAELWRNEVQDRLARYKHRRGRRIEGAYTMRFPFPADEPAIEPERAAGAAEPEMDAAAVAETSPEAELVAVTRAAQPPAVGFPEDMATEPAPGAGEAGLVDLVLAPPRSVEDDNAPFVDPFHRPRPKRKVIAFPKQASVVNEAVQRLADPVTTESPRILDVPEELEAIPATPFLDGLQLDLPTQSAVANHREHVDLPFQAVSTVQRVFAGVLDLAVAAVAAAVFAAVAYEVLSRPPLAKPLFLGLAAGAAVLWLVYHYLFLVHAGRTPGMMATGIRLCTFRGKAPNLRQRRNRVLGFYLSSLSLGMGLMWAMVDVDSLCWHDRLSQTYLSHQE